MDAFSKELAGLLCSDHQAWRVLENKIVPKMVDVLVNRMSNSGGAYFVSDAIGMIDSALKEYASSEFIDEVRKGFFAEHVFALYDILSDQEKPCALEMAELEDDNWKAFLTGFDKWKAANK